jgi:molecular chaperone GrpE
MSPDPKAPETTEPEAPEAAEQPQVPEATELAPEPEATEPQATKTDATETELQEPVTETEVQVPATEPDIEELAAKAKKADEYLQLAQRTQADFENYRKRAMREAAAAQERGVVKLARELLPAVDNLDRALEAAQSASAEAQSDNGASPLVSGIELVHADVVAALKRFGIERFSPVGEQFDPQHHEAVAQQPVEGAQPGTIIEVYQRGYSLGDTVLRPARVVVAA